MRREAHSLYFEVIKNGKNYGASFVTFLDFFIGHEHLERMVERLVLSFLTKG